MILAAVASGYALGSLPVVFPLGGNAAVARAVAVPPPGDATPPPGGQGSFFPVIEAGDPGRVPGEFEAMDALLLGVNELIEYHPETLVQIVAALEGRTRIVALIAKPDQETRTRELLRGRGLATDAIRFFLWPAESMWVQDFGPRMVVGGEPRVIDFEYQVPGREVENQLPMAFAATFGMKITHCRLAMEGGSYLSNGRGLCISSTRLIEQNVGRGHDLQAIGRLLNRHFGFNTWACLPPILGESTGHLDLFLSVGGPATVFLAAYDPDADPENAARMDDNASTLAETVTGDGRPLAVIRVPQPAARDGCWRSYTNVIYADGVVIVPQYPDFSPDLDRQALTIYREAFPDRRIVGIDASGIAPKRGGLHCLSLVIPRMPTVSESAPGQVAAARDVGAGDATIP